MNLFLMTQHSPDGAAAGLQTMRVEPIVNELSTGLFTVYPGGNFLALPADLFNVLQVQQVVPSFAMRSGPYLQTPDLIVMQADNMLKFGGVPVHDREILKETAQLLSEGHD